MFLEWWMIVILLIVLGIWAEYRYRSGLWRGLQAGVQYQHKQQGDHAILAFVEEIKLEPREIQAQSVAIYSFTRKLQALGIIKFNDDGTVQGYSRKKINVEDLES